MKKSKARAKDEKIREKLLKMREAIKESIVDNYKMLERIKALLEILPPKEIELKEKEA